MNLFQDWYKFLLSILFWIFLWRVFDLILDEINLDRRNKLIFYVVCVIVVGILISNDKYFFKT